WLNDMGIRMNEWQFNCLQFAQDTRFPLVTSGLILLNKTAKDLGISSQILKRFLATVEEHYKPVRYHNSTHATMVAQKMHCLICKLNMFDHMDTMEYFIAILSGLCHDVGHPGRNNSFFVNSMEPLAIVYNDIAVLENFHSSLTFRFMKLHGCNLFKNLPISAFHLVRSRVIKLILATDMSAHFDKLSLFRVKIFSIFRNNLHLIIYVLVTVRRISNKLNFTCKDDLWLTLQMVIKTADLSHCVTEWDEHSKWCTRLVEEFFEQVAVRSSLFMVVIRGDEERTKGVAISPLCDRHKLFEVAQSQVGFLSFVVSPLFAEMQAIDQNGFIELVCNKIFLLKLRQFQ
ncbi:3'5'-cyclic nucleotide phosphodiesterase domain-containing protein, partial [Cardiosporidium cionae]